LLASRDNPRPHAAVAVACIRTSLLVDVNRPGKPARNVVSSFQLMMDGWVVSCVLGDGGPLQGFNEGDG
jgi:hypothetical protein